MAVINITITESNLQLLAGIPKFITLAVSIPSTIFYTLDGSTPDTSSSVYINSLSLPTNGQVTLKLWATNGDDASPIVTETWQTPSWTGNRNPHDQVLNPTLNYPSERDNMYPFGGFATTDPAIYGNTAGLVIENGDGYGYQDGYDGAGGIGNYTDQPLSEYDIIFSDSNRLGEQGRGLGTLPAQVTIRRATEAPESTNNNSKFFNPRAKVIFQDSTEEPYDPEMSQMNKQFFSFENAETAKGGAYLFTTGLEGNSPTGSFIRAYFNPREQKMTYYYRCSATNRWIISKEPYVPAVQNTLDLGSGMIFGTNNKVFQWIPFFSRPVF